MDDDERSMAKEQLSLFQAEMYEPWPKSMPKSRRILSNARWLSFEKGVVGDVVAVGLGDATNPVINASVLVEQMNRCSNRAANNESIHELLAANDL